MDERFDWVAEQVLLGLSGMVTFTRSYFAEVLTAPANFLTACMARLPNQRQRGDSICSYSDRFNTVDFSFLDITIREGEVITREL